MKNNNQIHNRQSTRLKGYDYSQAGLYFITVCAHNRECLFGTIVDGEMILNDAGKIANECWLQIPEHFPDAVLHEHVVMPNHVHGIIELKQNDTIIGKRNDIGAQNVGVQNFEPLQDNSNDNVGVENFQPLPPTIPKRNEFQKIIPRSIGSIIRGYKIGVTKWFRSNTDIVTVWQRNYHDHIIRNYQSYVTISEYIINNSKKWKDDKFYEK